MRVEQKTIDLLDRSGLMTVGVNNLIDTLNTEVSDGEITLEKFNLTIGKDSMSIELRTKEVTPRRMLVSDEDEFKSQYGATLVQFNDRHEESGCQVIDVTLTYKNIWEKAV